MPRFKAEGVRRSGEGLRRTAIRSDEDRSDNLSQAPDSRTKRSPAGCRPVALTQPTSYSLGSAGGPAARRRSSRRW
jgi:hypothetical protein